MFKSEAEKILKETKIEAQVIEVQGRTLKVGDTKVISLGGPASFAVNEATIKIVAFAEPAAHGFDGKWDDPKDCPAVVVERQDECHPAGKFDIWVAWDFPTRK